MQLFLSLPSEILCSDILSSYLDGLSLSTTLTALLSSNSHRHLKSAILTSLHLKLIKLKSTTSFCTDHESYDPHTEILIDFCGDVTINKLFRMLLTMFKSFTNKSIPIPPPSVLSKSLSSQLAILSFLQDEAFQIKTDSGVERALWCGPLVVDCGVGIVNSQNNNNNAMVKTAQVLVTTPDSTWRHHLLQEWANMLDRKTMHTRSLKPTPRRATPLPPLARLRGVTREDALVVSQIARRLDDLDEVIRMGGPSITFNRKTHDTVPMTVLIMSRKQAIRRLRSNRVFRKIPKNMWSLDYAVQPKTCAVNNETHSQIHSWWEIQRVHGCSTFQGELDDELFAFMDGPYSSLSDHDNCRNSYEDQTNDSSTIARDLIAVMTKFRKITPEHAELNSHSKTSQSSLLKKKHE